MSEMNFDVDRYEEELVAYIREALAEVQEVEDLADDDIEYLLSIWDEFVEILEEEGDEDEVDPDELYEFITDAIEEDEMELEIDMETLIALIEAEEDFIEEYDEEE